MHLGGFAFVKRILMSNTKRRALSSERGWIGNGDSSPGIGLQGTPERFEGGVVVTITDTDRMSVRSFTYDDTHQESCDWETNEGAELTGPLTRWSKVR